ncbi:rio1-domain-containing protein [Histomonas meleagridis]|uniref:rio1-domain-containing protein n=1 Tax=Histomonas meleagridis TaxID=135588 RepID=UPI003559AA4E|nr:rio1-domain-containing protein [Histomonas meleagridis]KAH0797036.1 rio1-domain-containing protein [Histomonas meleagridis]
MYDDDFAFDMNHKYHDSHVTPQMFDRFSSHIHLEINPDHFVDTMRNRLEMDDQKKKNQRAGKDHRKTEDMVLDNRTKVVLFKLLKRDILHEINGCISTGKEGNVYIGIRGANAPEDWPHEFAIKIYKTCILKFKDRDRYVSGEMRFQHKAGSRNSRKSVILWAEKEFRNLSRLNNCGIPSPRVLLVKANIIFMELITDDENKYQAPCLRDANLTLDEYKNIYKLICFYMRDIYHKCNLVHADLSEYNILIKNKMPIIIDVGQSVEQDNMNSTVFLRNDIAVITKYFKNKGVKTAPLMRLFEFVVEEKLIADRETVFNEIVEMEEDMTSNEFTKIYIPQRLAEVNDPDIEIEDMIDGDFSNAALHGALTGIIPSELAPYDDEEEDIDQIGEEQKDDQEEENNEQTEEEEEEEQNGDQIPVGTLDRKNYTKEEWKAIQKKIKEQRREKRKVKKPKALKRKQYRRSHPNAK